MAVEQEFQAIAEHYASRYESIAAVIAYGSRVHGKPTSDSHYDCWLVVRDYKEFYSSNMKDRRNLFATLFNPFDEARAHTFLNRINPNFYQERLDGVKVKYGVVSVDDFLRLCKPDARMYVKGRMQKPVRVIYCERGVRGLIDFAVRMARKDAVRKAAALLDDGFSLDELIKKVIGMSYMADIRPENPNKIDDIFETGADELREVYSKMLLEAPYHEKKKDVERYLFRNKFISGVMNLKNGLTNRFAFSYVMRKIRRSRER